MSETMKKRIMELEDFIYCPRLNNSLSKYIEKNPNGVEISKIAKALLMTEDEVEETYQSAIKKIKEAVGEK